MKLTPNLAAERYAATLAATQPQPREQAAEARLGAMADSFATALGENEKTAMAAMTSGADPHALVQALTQTELAVETAVTVRNKVVEAYQEILRMPV
jgi:flagellar hook-basal body complex protein FliE